jgi:hypothetical protein
MTMKIISKVFPELSITLREEHGLTVFENRVPRRIFGPKRENVTKVWRKVRMRLLIICTLRQILLG